MTSLRNTNPVYGRRAQGLHRFIAAPATTLSGWTACAAAAAAAALLGFNSASAAQDCFAVLASASSVGFRVIQSGSPFNGSFRRFGGTVCSERERVTRIDVWLDPASVDAGMPEIDAAIRDKDFFAAAQYPRINFVSSSVRSEGEMIQARGTLEIKGQRRDIEISFRLAQQGERRLAAGSFSLDRLHYGIGTGEWANTAWLGAQVQVDFKAALTRAN